MGPKISFGMIVLNGEPFLRYNLRSLYPLAHQIIVVEGACRAAAAVADPDGHSIDGTPDVLRQFADREDPEHKVLIVSARDEGFEDGFWPEKDEMSRAYASRATGEYLWQIDSDEFYHRDQVTRLLAVVEAKRPDAVSFPMLTFWGGIEYVANGFYLIRDNAREYHRLFAWGPGYTYQTHRPPTVTDAAGVDTRRKSWLRASDLERMGVFLYHYSLLFPRQVFNKVRYYKERVSFPIDSWEEAVYRRLERPFHVHNVYQHVSWLERFRGQHPAAVVEMMRDVSAGAVECDTRDCADVERLLSRRSYVLAARALSVLARAMSRGPLHWVYRAYSSAAYRLRRAAFRRPRFTRVDGNGCGSGAREQPK